MEYNERRTSIGTRTHGRWLQGADSGRLLAAVHGAEHAQSYFRRRAAQERRAAARAAGRAAQRAHQELARLYSAVAADNLSPSKGDADRRATERREALLDDALDDSFPASDPLAIVLSRGAQDTA